ncbi:MAG TPA: phosphate ABC transporter substrate-binding protein PstS [Candidatus Akkermansia intestinigallinarum]|uniref:Phosphate-binding protein n=1 Tax=Candidatus Akkermansia intestinigallinarum TaxID=2838431 RepID=A0A9D2AGQ5_9BACT|nr:phosphate ABC transporter substrate-binding protein PstS [Candidatus Akkermansia intestinigallinarum]
MIKKLIIALLAAGSLTQADTAINGAGASFPAPVYQKWTFNYSRNHPGTSVNYQSLGSGAGLNQIKAGTIDYAGSDNPLTLDEQKRDGLTQYPMLTGGVVVIVNLPGIADGQLKLSREVLSRIFLGDISYWNDEAIVALNPGLRLPKQKITVVHRADSSGTSFIFTNYLSKISADWKQKVGQGSAVNWPTGIGGQKNPGVCNNVARIRGAIGYTEYTYAVEAKLTCASLENAEGEYVKPSLESFSAAAAGADWSNAPGFYMELTNVPGKNSWPITGVTYVIIRNDTPAERRQAILNYLRWCYTAGAPEAVKLNYVPLPMSVVKLIEERM